MTTHTAPPSLLAALRPQNQDRLYDFYRDLRDTDELYWDRTLNAWVATGHQVVSGTAGDPRFSSVRYPDIDAVSAELRPLARVLSRQMLYSDAPDHGRLRSLLSRAFTPRAVGALSGRISAAVDQVLDRAAPTGRLDVVAELARPLPLAVICDLLGVPERDRSTLSAWSDPVAAAIGSSRLDEEEGRAASRAMQETLDYLRQLLGGEGGEGGEGEDGGERAEGGGDAPHTLRALLGIDGADGADGAGIGVSGGEQDRDLDELLANCALLLIAGHETTTHFIGNAALALLRHPEAADRLRARPELIPAAVEELLRYDSPVQLMLRRARHDLDLAGRRIAAGQAVLLVCGAANRDPAVFPDPDRLDFERPGGRHVAFGYGPHFCLGAALARLEGAIVLEALLTRLPDWRLDGPAPSWQRSLNFRGLDSLQVSFDPTPLRQPPVGGQPPSSGGRRSGVITGGRSRTRSADWVR
ncbi:MULTISPECIES: cytochrome P450 [Kitasatospora]|uniref:Putative cytochrome P450 n=1 Tax=Kitasatospora setae (strain ATCC 33774 / DSM 43861 / JCM 3304 / KCC A-0304 / NBRC 14216 / KM-6054) TaxID=452652 RepID=E4NJY6_KITSK|nr:MULTISPECIES: cytochrome P450 [Kitasatospora]BAJ33284.1 putative cytochrome P450 [Kitasatospora setae KM-6054]